MPQYIHTYIDFHAYFGNIIKEVWSNTGQKINFKIRQLSKVIFYIL